jgi:hypothetical protein
MSDQAQKVMFIVVDTGMEAEVLEILQDQGLTHYTKWEDCKGSGETGIREGNPIWPGLNSVFMVVMKPGQVEPLRAMLHARRDTFTVTPGLKLIVLDGVMM